MLCGIAVLRQQQADEIHKLEAQLRLSSLDVSPRSHHATVPKSYPLDLQTLPIRNACTGH